MGTFGCFEVTIGFYGSERVDYITYDTKDTWRCYEIKVSKSDFYSKAALSFVGHYNYFVLTSELYEEVKHDIPKGIGVYVNGASVKRATRQELKVDDEVLKVSMIRSLSREFQKQFQSGQPHVIEGYQKRVRNLVSDLKDAKRQKHDYRLKYHDLLQYGKRTYGEDWDSEFKHKRGRQ